MVIAFIPLARGREYCSKGVFFTCPFFVAIITKWLFMYSSFFKSWVQMKAFTLSSGPIFIKFCIALPFEALVPSGISKTRIQKHFPFWVKNNIYWWFVPTKRCSRKSSFRVAEAFCPTPPLFWVLYSEREVRFM